jgi:hypothetical protein
MHLRAGGSEVQFVCSLGFRKHVRTRINDPCHLHLDWTTYFVGVPIGWVRYASIVVEYIVHAVGGNLYILEAIILCNSLDRLGHFVIVHLERMISSRARARTRSWDQDHAFAQIITSFIAITALQGQSY